jgi:hypothetical protein
MMTPMADTARPFSDFLSAQGTTSLFFPPVPDYIGWGNNNPQTHFALIDYLGLASATLAANGGPSIATEVSGTVSEHSLSDGRAEVTVVVRTTKALSWVVGLPGDIFTDPRSMDIAQRNFSPIHRSPPRCPAVISRLCSRTSPLEPHCPTS